jgi:hypothetical protein
MFPDYAAPLPDSAACASRVRVSCVGYKAVTLTLHLVPGDVVRKDVYLVPTSGNRTPVSFAARFEDGTPFTGALLIDVSGAERGAGPSQRIGSALVVFHRGAGEQSVRLPPGRYGLAPRGNPADATMEMAWWQPAGGSEDVQIDGSRGTRHVVFRLAGSPISLHVVDGNARPVRGFDLALIAGGHLARTAPAWDVQQLSARSHGDETHESVLWLAPGTYTLRAALPGLGRGEALVEIAHARKPHAVTINLGK